MSCTVAETNAEMLLYIPTVLLFSAARRIEAEIGTRNAVNAINIVTEAEHFALQRGILPTGLLILDVTKALTTEPLKTNASLLVLDPLTRAAVERSGESSQPLYLDLIAFNLKIVVVSVEPWYDSHPSMPMPDPFQNFRHNCILHIAVNQPTHRNLFVNTLHWNHYGFQRFSCVRQFDHLVFWIDEFLPPSSCMPRKEVCSVRSLSATVAKGTGLILKFLEGTVVCNTTRIQVGYVLDARAHVLTEVHEEHMLSRFSTSRNTVHECYSFIRISKTNVTALLRPFEVEVWISTCLCLLILVRIIAWLNVDSLQSALGRTLMGFITVIEIKAKVRRYSHLFVIGCVSAMLFFIGLIYANLFTSFLLDPRIYETCRAREDVYNRPELYCADLLHYYLSTRYCLCNLDHIQQSMVTKPMSRDIYKKGNFRRGYQGRVWTTRYFLQKNFHGSYRNRHIDQTVGALQIVLIRVSSTIDRLFRTGIPNHVPLPKLRAWVKLYEADSCKIFSKGLREGWNDWNEKEGPRKLMEFNTTVSWFDESSLAKLRPIFEHCTTITFFVFFCERFALKIIEAMRPHPSSRTAKPKPRHS